MGVSTVSGLNASNKFGSGTKYVIPVAVLVILSMCLVGSAYAYTSSVSVSGGTAKINYLAIDLQTGDVDEDISFDVSKLIKFTNSNSYDNGNDRHNTVHYGFMAGLDGNNFVPICQYDIVVRGDAEFSKFTFDSDLEEIVAFRYNNDNNNDPVTLGDILTFKYVLEYDGHVVESTDSTFNVGGYLGNYTLKVFAKQIPSANNWKVTDNLSGDDLIECGVFEAAFNANATAHIILKAGSA